MSVTMSIYTSGIHVLKNFNYYIIFLLAMTSDKIPRAFVIIFLGTL
jgi:hypothetical protein